MCVWVSFFLRFRYSRFIPNEKSRHCVTGKPKPKTNAKPTKQQQKFHAFYNFAHSFILPYIVFLSKFFRPFFVFIRFQLHQCFHMHICVVCLRVSVWCDNLVVCCALHSHCLCSSWIALCARAKHTERTDIMERKRLKKNKEEITLFSFCSSFPFAFDFLLFFVIILLYHSYRFASYSFTLFGSSSSFLFCVHLSSFFTAAAIAAVVVHSSFIISFIHIFVWLWLHVFLSHSFFIHRERKNDVPTLSLPSSFSE